MFKTAITFLLILTSSVTAGEGIVSKWNNVSTHLNVAVETIKDINRINNEINGKIVYKADPADHWQTPEETLSLKSGDCEDYAILKYAVLHKLGYKDLRIVVGKLPRNGNIDHAWVEVKDGNDWIVLDNRNNITPKVDEVKAFYTPIFTMSLENGVMIGPLKLSPAH